MEDIEVEPMTLPTCLSGCIYSTELTTISVEDIGVEPMTLPTCLSGCIYSTELTTISVEDIGVEPMTLCVQGRCSSQLS